MWWSLQTPFTNKATFTASRDNDMRKIREGLSSSRQQCLSGWALVKTKLQNVYMVHLSWVWWRVCSLMELPCYNTLLVVGPTVFALPGLPGGKNEASHIAAKGSRCQAGASLHHRPWRLHRIPAPSQHIVSILFPLTVRNVRNYCFHFRIFFHYMDMSKMFPCSVDPPL